MGHFVDGISRDLQPKGCDVTMLNYVRGHQSQVIEDKLQQLETFKDDSNRYYQVLRSINNNKRKQPLLCKMKMGT